MEKAQAQANASGKAKWTVMVYMAGDNNLDDAALLDIVEMAKVGSTKDVNILVQLDRIEDKLTRCCRWARNAVWLLPAITPGVREWRG